MKLPCPIQVVVGSDGRSVSVVARSHANLNESFDCTWAISNKDDGALCGQNFFQWIRLRLPAEEIKDPVLATIILCDPSRFHHTTGWADFYSRDRVVVLDLRSMMFVLGDLGIFGPDSHHVWGEAVVQSSDVEVLQKKLEEQIAAVKSLTLVCGSLREVISAAGQIKSIVDSDPVAAK